LLALSSFLSSLEGARSIDTAIDTQERIYLEKQRSLMKEKYALKQDKVADEERHVPAIIVGPCAAATT
jgi:hypothetical protein